MGGGVLFLIIATLFKPKLCNRACTYYQKSLALFRTLYSGLYTKNAGLIEYLSTFLIYLNTQGNPVAVVVTDFTSAILSTFMNNMPTIMVMDFSNPSMIYANIIGCNLGAKITPFGSLATLLCLHTLSQEGVK